jgi:8-oxo-dGTP pyrophosphatase MutT (NUDIX family)
MLRAAKFDDSKEVPYLAGCSVNGKNYYVDKRLPKIMVLKDGRKIPVRKYLIVHEVVEKFLEQKHGYKYQYAHEKATGAERRAVEADKIPWNEYQNWFHAEVKKLAKLDSAVPKDMDLKPEHDYHDEKMIKEVHGLQKSEGVSEVASIAVIDGNKLLMGRRNDNQRWTLPGGHLNAGEPPTEGACRELMEEAGIKVEPAQLIPMGVETVTTYTGKTKIIHSFAVIGYFDTNSELDPDQEVQTWKYVDVSRGLPHSIGANLHSPKNSTLKALGLQND